jgi:hypothetical protein
VRGTEGLVVLVVVEMLVRSDAGFVPHARWSEWVGWIRSRRPIVVFILVVVFVFAVFFFAVVLFVVLVFAVFFFAVFFFAVLLVVLGVVWKRIDLAIPVELSVGSWLARFTRLRHSVEGDLELAVELMLDGVGSTDGNENRSQFLGRNL